MADGLFSWMNRSVAAALAAGMLVVLAGCGALPAKPAAVVRYDLGPAPAVRAVQPERLPLSVTPLQAPAAAEGDVHMHYRLLYAQPHVQHQYAQARWSAVPAQLVEQQLRSHMANSGRTLLPAKPGDMPLRVQGKMAPVLRWQLEEFSHVFTDPQSSYGWLRVRVSAVQLDAAGDRLLGQQVFDIQVPAVTADAAGGVQALSQSVEQLGQALVQWLDGVLPASF